METELNFQSLYNDNDNNARHGVKMFVMTVHYCMTMHLIKIYLYLRTHVNSAQTHLTDFYFVYFPVYDPCSENPCHNGGACIRSGNDYECKCQPGFTGKNCMSSKRYFISRIVVYYNHRYY